VSPTQARSAQAIAAIVGAARARFGDLGYEAASIDDIAVDAARTKGAVYHHFPDKRTLFEHVFTVEQREIAERVARSKNLPGGIAAYLRIIATTPAAARITLVDGPTVLGWSRWRSCDDGPFRSLLRSSLDRYERLAGHYDLDLLTELLLGAVTEAAHHVAHADDASKTARRYGTQFKLLVDGITGASLT
jgi:AcrR family transcriptional regulator